jgi:nucleotide-binding universal stress UspA family protein
MDPQPEAHNNAGYTGKPIHEEAMHLRDILVQLDSSPRTAERLALALHLAKRGNAKLTGIFAQRAAAYQVGVVAMWPPESYTQAANASREQFEAAVAGYGNARWIDLNRGSDHEVTHHLTETARHYDLTIVGQEEEDGPRAVPRELIEELIVESGRPILVVPYAGHFSDTGTRPLVAWTDARAAARALNDALVLVQPKAKVTVVSMGTGTEPEKLSAERIGEHLKAHNLDTEVEYMQVTEVGVMDTLLNLAADKAADLIVMGAFGGFGYPLLSRGAGTRYILHHMTVPCLFAH